MKQSILIVDDHEENLIALEAILEGPELELIKATSGNQALALLLKNDVALVILDVQMPEMDGHEVARLMRKNPKTQHIPIIFATANNSDIDQVYKGYGIGAVDYLFKPIDANVLIGKLNVFLELDRQKKELKQTLLQIRRLQQQNEKLLQAIGEGIISLNVNGEMSFINPAAREIMAPPEGLSLGSAFDQFGFLDSAGKKVCSWEDSPVFKTCKEGGTYNSDEFYAVFGTRHIPIEMTCTPVDGPDEKFAGVVIVFRDISARKGSGDDEAKKMRSEPRKRINIELNMFDRTSGATLGRLVNISTGGFKVLSKDPIRETSQFQLSMILPESINGSNTMSLDALCIWCAEVGYSGDYAAGFKIQNNTETNIQIIKSLIEKY